MMISNCAFVLGGSPKGVSRGAGRSCWLPVELVVLCLCVGRFPEGRVPRRRKVALAACRAGRAVLLRQEVPRRACPEAQEGRAGCVSSWLCCAFAWGSSPKGVSRGKGRSCLSYGCVLPLRALNSKSDGVNSG